MKGVNMLNGLKGLVSVLIILCLPLFGSAVQADKLETERSSASHVDYYRIDTVRTIYGEIMDIRTEKSFKKKDFTVLYVKEKKTDKLYRVEVSPQWFFDLDLMVGSRLEISGSVKPGGDLNRMMTRSITYQGDVFHFRDGNGFPLWRGRGRFKERSGGGKRHQRGHR